MNSSHSSHSSKQKAQLYKNKTTPLKEETPTPQDTFQYPTSLLSAQETEHIASGTVIAGNSNYAHLKPLQ